MKQEPWLPVGFLLADREATKSLLQSGDRWQIYSNQNKGKSLVVDSSLLDEWVCNALVKNDVFTHFNFLGKKLAVFSGDPKNRLVHVQSDKSPGNKAEAISFAKALKETRLLSNTLSLGDSLYVEELNRLLPTDHLAPSVPDAMVLGSWLSGGVPVSADSQRRLRTFMSWLGERNLKEVLSEAGLQKSRNEPKHNPPECSSVEGTDQGTTGFILPGRPELEQFVNEHIVDLINNHERYSALGIDFPSAVILHGPPGCGKTFAIERLIEYLDWPSYNIEASSVSSPYIHETSKKVAHVFDEAIKNAPSVLVIDEMEAFLADRSMGEGHHRVEEVAEFLRRIPEAIKKKVLIVAMTNRIDMIDDAILRRGRFDHVIKVDYASKEEVLSLLENLLSKLPKDDSVNLSVLAEKLARRPLSDVSFIVREGARLAARAGKSKIDQECLMLALAASPSRTDEQEIGTRIGFV